MTRRHACPRALAAGLVLLVAAAARAAAPAAAPAPVRFPVRYVSADHVYLEGGAADGLAAGDTLAVSRDGRPVATLVVAHAADHSASCALVAATEAVRPGDVAVPARDLSAPVAPTPVAAAPASAPDAPPAPSAPPPDDGPAADISGWAALEWSRYDDRSAAGLDHTQPTLRLNLKARRLGGRDVTFAIRARARRDERARSYGAVPAEEWSHRVYVLSLGTESRDAAFSWQAGRLASTAIAATGPVDGALVETHLGDGWRAGAFAGTLPDWRDSAPRSSLQKYGLFLRVEKGQWSGRRWSGALAATTEQHGGDVSRRYLYLRGDWRAGPRWSLFQSVELDLNDGWRRDAAGESVSLTNLWLGAGWRPGERLALNLSYDNRKSPRDLDNRALPDSLFDAAFRQGLRASASVRVARGWDLFGNAGWSAREGEAGDATWSWAGGATGADLLGSGLRLTAQAHGFDGPWARGLNPSLHVQKAFAAGHLLGVAAGAYLYTPAADDRRRDSRWARVEATWRWARRCYLSAQAERGWGDDLDGDRLVAETGVSF